MMIPQVFKRAAAYKLSFFPGAPEGDARCFKLLYTQRMDTLRRRLIKHALQMLRYEGNNLRTAQLINPDFHSFHSLSLYY
ncbi:hypothetical protein D3C76_1709400 [compost metagenome]